MTARSIDIARIEAWDRKWDAEDMLSLLGEIVGHLTDLHELVTPRDSEGKYDGVVLEQADDRLGWIETRIGVVEQFFEDQIRDALARDCA